MLLKYTAMVVACNGVVLVLDEQAVRWYWCMLECVIAWLPSMHYGTIEIQHSGAMNWNTLQWRLHGTVVLVLDEQVVRWYCLVHA